MKPLRALWLAVAAAIAAAVLSPPVDALCDRSFAWHMAQHLALLFAVPLFVLLADPFALVLRVLGAPRSAAVLRATARVRNLGSPAASLFVFVAVLWISHFSPLYAASLDRESVHVLEHALYVCAGFFFWLPVVAPPPMPVPPFPARILYLMLALPQGALLAVALNGARAPLYAHYERALGFEGALRDQSDAAAVMWIAGGFIVFASLLITLGRWAARERRALRYTAGERA